MVADGAGDPGITAVRAAYARAIGDYGEIIGPASDGIKDRDEVPARPFGNIVGGKEVAVEGADRIILWRLGNEPGAGHDVDTQTGENDFAGPVAYHAVGGSAIHAEIIIAFVFSGVGPDTSHRHQLFDLGANQLSAVERAVPVGLAVEQAGDIRKPADNYNGNAVVRLSRQNPAIEFNGLRRIAAGQIVRIMRDAVMVPLFGVRACC